MPENWIRTLRIKRGLTINELVEGELLSKTVIRNADEGKSSPVLETAVLLAYKLGASSDDVYKNDCTFLSRHNAWRCPGN